MVLRTRNRSAIAVLVVTPVLGMALGSSCTHLRQYRTVTVEAQGTATTAGGFADRICDESAPNDRDDRCALEHRSYTYQGEEHDYYFATVEFDDQGWFWDRRQMEALLRLLYGLRDPDGEQSEFLIFAHAHGWEHNADACDDNVVCFERLLERMDLSERAYAATYGGGRPPRKIVGVYLGWRGASGTFPTLRATTFWARKRAARRVGIGGVGELLNRLNDFRHLRNPGHKGSKTQLIISGHSFGGQVIYKALAQSLIERATRMSPASEDRSVEGAYGYGIASSFGDLVILVNPAFEGSDFESLQFAATHRCYLATQWPAMLVVTSKADDATRRAFPFGRFFSNLASKTRCRDQRKAVLHTVGHLDRYLTHVLRLEPPGEPPRKRKDGPCGCPYLAPIEDFVRADRDAAFYRQIDEVEKARKRNDGRIHEIGGAGVYDAVEDYRVSSYGTDASGAEIVLERSPDYAANYPYLVISTTADFIPDHSTIYGERFTDFLRRFYFRHLAAKLNFPEQCFEKKDPQCLTSDITPCQVSWTGRLGYGCDDGGASDGPGGSEPGSE